MFQDLAAVLFDLDGTLVRTNIDFAGMRRSLLELVSGAGLDPEPFRGLDLLAILTGAAARLEAGVARNSFLERGEAALVAIELVACAGVSEMEGARATLDWLVSSGLRVGIVTRNSPPAVARILKQVVLPHEVLLTRADTPRVKPDPIHLRLALDRLRVPPGRALMVGDHLMDIQGGKAAGMRTLGLLDRERPPDYFAPMEPDGVIRSLPELRRWISPLSS